jgi:hypothetical protein
MNKAFVREPDTTDVLCPRCGAAGVPVVRAAFETHVPPDARRALAASTYFCSTPTCQVAYFDAVCLLWAGDGRRGGRCGGWRADPDTRALGKIQGPGGPLRGAFAHRTVVYSGRSTVLLQASGRSLRGFWPRPPWRWSLRFSAKLLHLAAVSRPNVLDPAADLARDIFATHRDLAIRYRLQSLRLVGCCAVLVAVGPRFSGPWLSDEALCECAYRVGECRVPAARGLRLFSRGRECSPAARARCGTGAGRERAVAGSFDASTERRSVSPVAAGCWAASNSSG